MISAVSQPSRAPAALAVAVGCAGCAAGWLSGSPLACLLLAAAFGTVYVAARRRTPRNSEEEILRTSVECTPGFAWTANLRGAVEIFNPRIIHYLRSPGEPEPPDWTTAMHPDDIQTSLQAWRVARRSGERYRFELRMRRFDGAFRWFLSSSEPARDELGNIVRWHGLLIDIDDQKRAEQALAASERELRTILEGLPGFIAAFNAKGENDYVNRSLLDFLGVEATDVARFGWAALIHPEDRDDVVRAWLRCVESGDAWDIAFRVRRFDGEYRWFHSLAEPRRDESGRIVRWYALLLDIDDKRKTEDALRTLQLRLSHASQLATVAELSASIAHEVNQPLAAVVANGGACLRWISAEPPELDLARGAAERLIRDAHTAAEIVRRIRALFRKTPVTRVPLDLNQVIREVCQLLVNELREKNVKVETELEPLPATLADRVQMQQVLVNLMNNAVEAMQDSALDGPKSIAIRSRAQASEVVVEVCDRGAGLEDAERVFEPLFTTKSDGMGMGLAICRTIVEGHEGRLFVTRNQSRGMTFSFSLPVHPSGAG